MAEHEMLLAVVEDPGTENWLDQALEGSGRLEKVSRADLGRVLRLLEATGAGVALVEVSERDVGQSMAVITALGNARPWVTVVAICRTADQDMLLQCMRAGARDCVVVGSDATELRDRLRRHQLIRPGYWGEKKESKVRNLIMVAGVSPLVDSAFVAENLALAITSQQRGARVLALDVEAKEEGVFHLESAQTFDLGQLLTSPDTLDDTLIETALEEFRPGLRLLPGGDCGDVFGDRGADLFIALTRLMGMFDYLVLNVANVDQSAWIRSLGIHAAHLLVVSHPEVGQLRHTREQIVSWRPHLPDKDAIGLVVDGYEAQIPPTLEEIADGAGSEVLAALPMDWRHRLEAMNLGVPMAEVAPKSGYVKQIKRLAAAMVGEQDKAAKDKARKGLFKRQA